MSERVRDKPQIGVTPDRQAMLDEIMGLEWFAQEADAFRLAISLAVANDLSASDEEMVGIRTKWGTSTVDQDGRLRQMIAVFCGIEDRPYAHAERLGAAGLPYLRKRLIDEHAQLNEIMNPTSSAE